MSEKKLYQNYFAQIKVLWSVLKLITVSHHLSLLCALEANLATQFAPAPVVMDSQEV